MQQTCRKPAANRVGERRSPGYLLVSVTPRLAGGLAASTVPVAWLVGTVGPPTLPPTQLNRREERKANHQPNIFLRAGLPCETPESPDSAGLTLKHICVSSLPATSRTQTEYEKQLVAYWVWFSPIRKFVSRREDLLLVSLARANCSSACLCKPPVIGSTLYHHI